MLMRPEAGRTKPATTLSAVVLPDPDSPTIASDVPGCREIVIHERAGLLFPVDDVPALADVMVRIAGDRQLRAHYAIAARELVVEKFAADIIGRQTVQLYRSLLETGGITQ